MSQNLLKYFIFINNNIYQTIIMWSLKQDKIDEIISFLKESQTPKNEIQNGIFKVNIYLTHL